jgi:flagellar basal body-associated protein FliL
MFSPFAEDEEQPKKRSAGTAIVIVLLLIIAAAAAFWFLAPPSMKARLGLASAGATPLQLVTTHMDRQHLESGNDLLTLTGRVINPSATEQVVPPIQAQLKSKSGKVVYSWTIQPPAQTLPAGASASFNSAEVSVPPGGDELTITLGDAKASGA